MFVVRCVVLGLLGGSIVGCARRESMDDPSNILPDSSAEEVLDGSIDGPRDSCFRSLSDSSWTTPLHVDSWFVDLDGIRCKHPEVIADCMDGWCRIPAGCYVMGSPPSEWGRGPSSEDERAVVLTHSFRMQQYEVTRREWLAMGYSLEAGSDPKGGRTGDCGEEECPAASVSWYEAAAYANALSEKEGLHPCYLLEECTGTVGVDFRCQSVGQSDGSLYECTGYRLPMEVEWEYAARAGSRTAFYAGDVTPQGPAYATPCCTEHALEQTAWYCNNSGNWTHPVGQKLPNAWGLFDMLGNAAELTNDPREGTAPSGPLVDYGAVLSQKNNVVIRGGPSYGWLSILRCAADDLNRSREHKRKGANIGFRLVIRDD